MIIDWKELRKSIIILMLIVIPNIYYELDMQIILIIYMITTIILFLLNKLNLTTILCILFCLDTFHKIKFNILGPDIYFNQIYVCMIILGIFLKNVRSLNKIEMNLPTPYIYVYIYVCANIIFNMYNKIPQENWNVLIIIILSIFESILVFNLFKNCKIDKLLHIYLISYIFNFVMILVEILKNHETEAFSGLLIEPNIGGSFYATSLLISIGMYKYKLKDKKIYNIYIFISFLGLIFTVTRASWISSVICLILFNIIYDISKKNKVKEFYTKKIMLKPLKTILCAVLIVPLLMFFAIKNDLILSKMQNTFNFESGTGRFRMIMFEQAIDAIKENPFNGEGTSSFGIKYNYDEKLSGLENEPAYLPNLYLATFYDTGLIGILSIIIFFTMIIFILIRKIKVNNSETIIANSLLVGFINFLICYNATSGFWFSGFWNYISIIFIFIYQNRINIRLNS